MLIQLCIGSENVQLSWSKRIHDAQSKEEHGKEYIHEKSYIHIRTR